MKSLGGEFLSEADLVSGAGHLRKGSIGDRLEQRIVENLAGQLRRLNAFLIVTWPDGVECPAELEDYVATPGRPNLVAVLRSHISAQARHLLADERGEIIN